MNSKCSKVTVLVLFTLEVTTSTITPSDGCVIIMLLTSLEYYRSLKLMYTINKLDNKLPKKNFSK